MRTLPGFLIERTEIRHGSLYTITLETTKNWFGVCFRNRFQLKPQLLRLKKKVIFYLGESLFVVSKHFYRDDSYIYVYIYILHAFQIPGKIMISINSCNLIAVGSTAYIT